MTMRECSADGLTPATEIKHKRVGLISLVRRSRSPWRNTPRERFVRADESLAVSATTFPRLEDRR